MLSLLERGEKVFKKSKPYLIQNLKLFSEKLKECVSSRILKVRKKVKIYLVCLEETFQYKIVSMRIWIIFN